MVMNNPSYEEQTRRLLSEAQSELGALDAEIAKLQDSRLKLVQEVNAYEIALQGYFRRSGRQVSAEIDWSRLLNSVPTHKDRLKLIAKQNDGRMRVGQATDILYTKGFIKAKKRSTAYTMVQVMLADMEKKGIFEKMAPGQYRLVDVQPSLPTVS